MKKRLFCLLISAVMTLSMPLAVLADEESDLQKQKDANSAALHQTKDDLAANENAHSIVTEEISILDNQLITLMSNIDVTEADLAEAEERHAEKVVELADAEEVRDNQFSDMKTRIQYIYEKDSSMSWLSYVLEADSIEEFLNRVTYAQQINQYDRNLLADYQSTVEEITEIKENIELKEEELALERQSLEEQKAQLNAALEDKKKVSSDYEAEIASLKAKADDLTATIAAQSERIKQIQEEKRRAEEEARRKAEEEARRAAEEAERARKEAEAAAAKAAAEKEAAAKAKAEKEAAAAAEAARQAEQAAQQQQQQAAAAPAPSAPAAPAAPTGDAAARALALANQYAGGPYYSRVLAANQAMASVQSARPGAAQELVNFSMQFQGRPYVVAGESLTNGCDCAGFIKALYRDYFGISFDRNLEMYNLMGIPVSTGELQPGDIILYAAGGGIGHVALYIGNGLVINASDPSCGIVVRAAFYRPIVSCRRFFCY